MTADTDATPKTPRRSGRRQVRRRRKLPTPTRSSAGYVERTTVPLRRPMYADLVCLAQTAGVTMPEAIRRAVQAGLATAQANADAARAEETAADMEARLKLYDPGSDPDREAE